jgi:hypothetical protein
MEISPQLRNEITDFLETNRADKTALSFYYKSVFGLELNTKCSICIQEGVAALQKITQTVNKIKMANKNFQWTEDKQYANASVTVRVNGILQTVTKANLTDESAAVIATITKYAHLVTRISGNRIEKQLVGNEEKEPVILEIADLEDLPSSNSPEPAEVTTSTLQEQPKEKKKPGPKPKNQK